MNFVYKQFLLQIGTLVNYMERLFVDVKKERIWQHNQKTTKFMLREERGYEEGVGMGL